MKLFYAFIFTISSTTLAFPQPDPILDKIKNLFTQELTFEKASKLVPKNHPKLLAENYPYDRLGFASKKGYLVVRDTKAENYYVVSDKAKDKLESGKFYYGSVVYKATKYITGKKETKKMIGHPIALKRYSESYCVNTNFPITNEEKALKLMGMYEGDLIKIDTGEKGCFMPMKLGQGEPFLNLIKSGKLTVGKFGPGAEENPSSSIVKLLNSVEMELKKFNDKKVIRQYLHLDNVMIDETTNFKISFIFFGFFDVNITDFVSIDATAEQLKNEMRNICHDLLESFDVSLKMKKSNLVDKRRWPDNVIDSFQKDDFKDVISELCRNRYDWKE